MNWHGMSMQDALRKCEVVAETKMTDTGPGDWYYLKLGDKLIPLGDDEHFASMLAFATRRNAEAFERPFDPPEAPPLIGGLVAKGGHNDGPSQVKERPVPPAPMSNEQSRALSEDASDPCPECGICSKDAQTNCVRREKCELLRAPHNR